jgi:hypothetical protein
VLCIYTKETVFKFQKKKLKKLVEIIQRILDFSSENIGFKKRSEDERMVAYIFRSVSLDAVMKALYV